MTALACLNRFVPIPRTATRCRFLQHSATLCNTLQHSATLCNTLQHSAPHCNTLQHLVPMPHTYVAYPLLLCGEWTETGGGGIRGVGEVTGDGLDFFRLVGELNNPSLCSSPTHITPHSQETVGKEAYTLQHTATHCNKPQHTRRPQIVRRQLGKRATRRGLFAA